MSIRLMVRGPEKSNIDNANAYLLGHVTRCVVINNSICQCCMVLWKEVTECAVETQ